MPIFRQILRSKIHGGRITERELDYNGSVGIDKALLREADMVNGEKVHVLNFNNGMRFETYVIEKEEGSKKIALYGPAARCGEVGDRLCIISYASVTDEDIEKVHAKTIFIDKHNKITNLV